MAKKKIKIPCTDKMKAYAEAISTQLDIKSPDYNDFEATSKFIGKHKEEYLKSFNCEWYKEIIKRNKKFKYEEQLTYIASRIANAWGCYVLWHNDEIVYVGKSTNLADRIVTSTLERNEQEKITGITILKTETVADMHILEPFLITNLKPRLNKEFMCEDTPKIFDSTVNIEFIVNQRAEFEKITQK